MMKNEQHNAAHIRAMAAGLRDGMGGHADACADLMEQLAKGVSAAKQAPRKTVTLEELVAELKADTHGDAISAAMDQAVADMALGRAMRSAKRAEPRCACGDGFTEDAMCANCIAAAAQAQQADHLRDATKMIQAEPVAWSSVERMAADRYRVVSADNSMFYRFAVVAGDGNNQLFIGREIECRNMARKFAGAFLDGAFVAMGGWEPAQPPAVAEGCGACGDGCNDQGCRLERESPPTCQTCNGKGMIGGLLPNGGGYDGEPCPDCSAPQATAEDSSVVQADVAMPGGYKLVPIKPTDLMLDAAVNAGDEQGSDYYTIYAAMLAAAQKGGEA